MMAKGKHFGALSITKKTGSFEVTIRVEIKQNYKKCCITRKNYIKWYFLQFFFSLFFFFKMVPSKEPGFLHCTQCSKMLH